LEGIRSAGRNPRAALDAVGLRPALLEDPEARVSTEMASALWREAVTTTSDRAFGVHVAQMLRPGTFDVLDYAVRSSPTLGEGARLYQRYVRILNTGARTALVVGDERVSMTFTVAGPPLAPAWIEFVLASWVAVGRQTTDRDWAPIEVRFTHGRPKSLEEHRRFFRCPLKFSSESNTLVLSRAIFELPQVAADAGLCAVLKRHASELFRELPSGGSLTGQVRHLVKTGLDRGDVSMEAVAHRLHMSVRTLGRRLSEEGTTYQRLLGQIRSELAFRYLREETLSVEEVAMLLGFADVAAFRRAFKRWTGQTPGEFRGLH
jgi:AraC-like DNA-binding protein